MNVIEVYERRDAKTDAPLGEYDWRVRATNGNIVATSGGQGYVDRGECERMALAIVSPRYAKQVVHK